MNINDDNYKDSVREIQNCLRNISHKFNEIPFIASDGIYGDKTKQAVCIFQKLFGLIPTGIVDSGMWQNIMNEFNQIEEDKKRADSINIFKDKNEIIKLGRVCDIAAIIQVMQNAICRYVQGMEKVNVCGTYDQHTEKNTKMIQELCNLTVTGEVDKATWNAYVRINNIFG